MCHPRYRCQLAFQPHHRVSSSPPFVICAPAHATVSLRPRSNRSSGPVSVSSGPDASRCLSLSLSSVSPRQRECPLKSTSPRLSHRYTQLISRVDALYLSHTPAWRSSSFRSTQEQAAANNEDKHRSRSLHREKLGDEPAGKASQLTSARTSAEESV